MPVSSMKRRRAARRMTLRRRKLSRSCWTSGRSASVAWRDFFCASSPSRSADARPSKCSRAPSCAWPPVLTISSKVASGLPSTKWHNCSSCASVSIRSLPGGELGIRWPSASRRKRILRTQLSLTPRISATSRLLAPSSASATARSRRSSEYGLIIPSAVNTVRGRTKSPFCSEPWRTALGDRRVTRRKYTNPGRPSAQSIKKAVEGAPRRWCASGDGANS